MLIQRHNNCELVDMPIRHILWTSNHDPDTHEVYYSVASAYGCNIATVVRLNVSRKRGRGWQHMVKWEAAIRDSFIDLKNKPDTGRRPRFDTVRDAEKWVESVMIDETNQTPTT